jgi:epoxyqueuosine reductase
MPFAVTLFSPGGQHRRQRCHVTGDTRPIAHAERQHRPRFINRTTEAAAASRNDDKSIAKPLGMAHHMRRKNDGCPPVALRQYQIFQPALIDRIQSGKGFVQDNQFRVVHQRANHLDHLRHALGQFADLFARSVGKAEQRQSLVGSHPALIPRKAAQRAHEGDRIAGCHSRVKPAFLRQITDTRRDAARAVTVQQPPFASVGINNAEQHSQRSRFTRPIGTQNAKDRTLWDRKVNPFNRPIAAKAFAQPLGNNNRFVQSSPHCHCATDRFTVAFWYDPRHDAADYASQYKPDVKNLMTAPAILDQPSDHPATLSAHIRALAAAHGFVACGIARADATPRTAERLRQWLAEGCHGDMLWMESRADQRASPQALWPDVRSVIMLGMSYAPAHNPLALEAVADRGRISVYAQGQDYHDVVKRALKALARDMIALSPDSELKVFVDTAPVMEKPLAEAAGLGWQGKHSNIVSQTHGSWLFLGAIYSTLDLIPDEVGRNRCGSCDACQRACPTDAFPAPYRVDARRCISYLTIEHKGPIPHEFRRAIGNRIYGCDDCLAVCPWNKFAQSAAANRAFLPRAELVAPKLADLLAMDDAAFRAIFAGSPIKRVGRNRMVRNAAIAAGNSKDATLVPRLRSLTDDEDPAVADAAQWALEQLA